MPWFTLTIFGSLMPPGGSINGVLHDTALQIENSFFLWFGNPLQRNPSDFIWCLSGLCLLETNFFFVPGSEPKQLLMAKSLIKVRQVARTLCYSQSRVPFRYFKTWSSPEPSREVSIGNNRK